MFPKDVTLNITNWTYANEKDPHRNMREMWILNNILNNKSQ